jgi:hypothetical protein
MLLCNDLAGILQEGGKHTCDSVCHTCLNIETQEKSLTEDEDINLTRVYKVMWEICSLKRMSYPLFRDKQ